MIALRDSLTRPAQKRRLTTGITVQKRLWLFAFVLFAIGFFSVSARASDNFLAPTIIAGSGSTSGSNVGASADLSGTEPGVWTPINSIWYRWTAPSAGTLVIQTCGAGGTNFDTTLAAYTGNPITNTPAGSSTPLASNDDTTGCATATGANLGSRISINVSQGVDYFIQVDGWSNNTGTYLLQYAFTPAAIVVNVTDSSATEGGTTAAFTATFTIRLATQPTAGTTVTIGPDPSGQCNFLPLTRSFTTANWATAQSITVTAVNDVIPEGVHSCSPGSITASGSNYATVSATPPVLTVVDNDLGIIVATTTGTATEGGANGAFTIKLATLPTANVTVTIGADPATPDQCSFPTSTFTFTTGNWSTPQTVAVAAVNDALVEGTHTCTTGVISASGGGYTGITGTAPTFTITDNDVGALTVATTTATATEGGATGAFTVVLTAQPASNVTVTIGADGSGQCGFAPTPLTFTNANWNMAQTVTTTAVDDALVEGTHSCTTGTIASSGSGYTATGTAPTFTITDNDVGALTVATTTATATEGGATGAFTVVLTAQPASNVTVTIGADGSGQCGFAPTPLTFTNANWSTAQTVTTTAVDDALVEGTHSCTTGTIASSGSGYTATGTAPTFTITDNDIASIAVSKSAGVASVAMPGDFITYAIQVTNSGNVAVTSLTLTDSLVAVTCPTSGTNTILTLAPSATETCTASYIATQDDFDTNGGGDGDIDNSVLVAGTGGGVPVSATASAAVACAQVKTLTFSKTSPAPFPLTAGQVVTYYFTATNAGNVTITDVSIDEISFNGWVPLGTPSSETLTDNIPLNTVTVQSQDSVPNNGIWSELKPNDAVTFSVTYTVQQEDIDALQ